MFVDRVEIGLHQGNDSEPAELPVRADFYTKSNAEDNKILSPV